MGCNTSVHTNDEKKRKEAIVVTSGGTEAGVDLVADSSISCGVYIAVAFFGWSASIVSNSLWVELPVLSKKLPEGDYLYYYFLGALLFGNLAALLFLLSRKCSRTGGNEIPALYLCVVVSVLCVSLLGFFWEQTIVILDKYFSLVMLLCVLVVSQLTCLAGVTYIPFTARLKAGYITAILLGETLANLFPHILGIAQGLSIPPECPPTPNMDFLNETRMYGFAGIMRPGFRGYQPSTTMKPITPPKLRFPENIYFLVVSGITALSVLSLAVLRHVASARFEYDELHVECMDDERAPGIEDPESDDLWHPHLNDGTIMLDDGSFRQALRADGINPSPGRTSGPKMAVNKQLVHFRGQHLDRSRTGSGSSNPSRIASSTGSEYKDLTDPINTRDLEKRIPSFSLLMIITFWGTAVTSGPLSSVKAHACVPEGNTAFFIGTILTNVISFVTCLVVLRISAKLKVTLVVAFTCLATILLTYFVALIWFSHESESKENSPIYGSFGELLVTVAWVAIVGLFYFARVTIAVVCRHHGREGMVWYAGVSQLGAAVGAMCMVDSISICRVYRSYQEAHCTQF